MTLKWKALVSAVLFAGMTVTLAGCELDECTDDLDTVEDECADLFAVDDDAIVEGEEEGDEVAIDPDEAIGCGSDGFCNAICADDAGDPTDSDCNPTIPGNAESGDNDWSSCECDYWGFVCEAASKCSIAACDCDPDCLHPEQTLPACNIDGHCDSWCPTDTDPDCLNDSEKNGKHCGSDDPEVVKCDVKVDNCDASPGTADACPDDPACDDFDLPCEGDGWCDDKCVEGADPDCL